MPRIEKNERKKVETRSIDDVPFVHIFVAFCFNDRIRAKFEKFFLNQNILYYTELTFDYINMSSFLES